MSAVADHAKEAARQAEAAARISSYKQVIQDDGTRVPDQDGDPLAYKDRAFECLSLAVFELAKAIEELSKKP